MCEIAPHFYGSFRHLRAFGDAYTVDAVKEFANLRAVAYPRPASPPMERRKLSRYRVALPLVFRWVNSGRRQMQSSGVTYDISTAGAYVLASTLPPANAVLDVEIDLLGFREPHSRMKSRMKVLRVDRSTGNERGDSGRVGFSMVGDEFTLLRGIRLVR
jgi:hypothetical protein